MEDATPLYVPYTEEVNTACWVVDSTLMMFTNIQERSAAIQAEAYPEHIYFFAELSVPAEEQNDHIIHRDASTGQFVTEEYTDAHPDTTITEGGEENA